MAKNRLGRGLSAILDDVEDAYRQDIESDSTVVKEIPLSQITPNIYQPRKSFNQEALQELSSSLQKHGQLQPIVVIEKDDGFMIIAGERRFRASKLAGFEKIKAIVANYENENLRELALIENIQRENLSPLELAQSYKELIDEYQITQDALSDIIHKSRSQITNTLRLLQLSEYTQNLLTDGKITQGHAKVLVGLDHETEKMIADTIVGQKLSVRDSEELVKSLKQNVSTSQDTSNTVSFQTSSASKLPKIDDLVKRLKDKGFKVSNSKNKVALTFEDEAQINTFLSLLSDN